MNEQVKQLDKSRIGIIQLSDLQYGKKHRFQDSDMFADKLVNDIRKMANKDNFRPLYVVLSGDISETGDTDEFAKAKKVLLNIFSELNITRKEIFCIPGNHDVNRKLSKKSVRYYKIIDILTKVLKKLFRIDPEVNLNENVRDQLKLRYFFSFSSAISQEQSQLIDSYPKVTIEQFKDEYGFYIEFILLNSCEKIDYKNTVGYVCPEKLRKTLQGKKTDETIKIAVLHHQLIPLSNNNAEAIQNASDIEAILAHHKYNIVLTGHAHKGSIRPCKNPEGHEIIYAGCGSTGVKGEQREDGIQNQYCIHIIDFNKITFQTIWRAYNPAYITEFGQGGWTQDNSYDSNPTAELPISVIKSKRLGISQAKIGEILHSKNALFSKTEKEKLMRVAFLNLFGEWKENG